MTTRNMEGDKPIRIDYFSDVLCVWAYTAQVRLDELRQNFGSRIDVHYHFIPVFGCTEERIGEAWKERGGYPAYCRNVQEVCRGFPHVKVHPEIWIRNVPASSASCHQFLKGVQLLERAGQISAEAVAAYRNKTLFEAVLWRVREAFFTELRNVGERACQLEIAAEFGLPRDALLQQLDSGNAMAAMCRDLALQERYRVEGSPTYVLNEGRQKLYGNIGYRVIEVNVEELLRRPEARASWC
jgi:predicted DsbA family dithiol-disulfide isomerase